MRTPTGLKTCLLYTSLYKQDEVLAGMIALEKVVRIKVNKPYHQSTLARILTLVQDAAERKAPAELFIRRFALK